MDPNRPKKPFPPTAVMPSTPPPAGFGSNPYGAGSAPGLGGASAPELGGASAPGFGGGSPPNYGGGSGPNYGNAPPPESKSKTGLWIALGCGSLLLLGICGGGLVGGFLVMKADDDASTTSDPTLNPFQPAIAVDVINPPPEVALPFAVPLANRATRTLRVTAQGVRGSIPGLAVGTQCTFLIEIRERDSLPQGYWCHALPVCGSTNLYGDVQAGYFPCTVTDQNLIVGFDRAADDGDGAFQIDTRQSNVTIWDTSTERPNFQASFRIDSVM